MNKFNAADELHRWYAARQERFEANTPELNKATTTFETRTYVASMTVWGTGMVEFNVLDSASNREVIASDKECDSAESLWPLLDDYVRELNAMVR